MNYSFASNFKWPGRREKEKEQSALAAGLEFIKYYAHKSI